MPTTSTAKFSNKNTKQELLNALHNVPDVTELKEQRQALAWLAGFIFCWSCLF